MSFVGMVVGTLVAKLTTNAKRLKKALKEKGKDLGDALRESSPVLGFLWLKLPTWAWTVISAVAFPIILVLISHKYLEKIRRMEGVSYTPSL